MHVRIFRPAKTAMQSGRGNTHQWVLEYEPLAPKHNDTLMGWAGSRDTRGQTRLRFASQDAAVAFAEREGLAYVVHAEAPRKPAPIRSYSDNFRFDRVG